MKKKNLTGQRFGRLVAVRYIKGSRKTKAKWECVCDCGKTNNVATFELTHSNSQSCGCLRSELQSKERTKDMIGHRFGRLVVTERSLTQKDNHAHWVCKCDCGNQLVVNGRPLRRGNTQSCGCLGSQATLNGNVIKAHSKTNTSPSQGDRYTTDSIKWRMAVYERDGFKCQCCSKVGGELNAHHILSWHGYPEKRFDVDNGITLCVDCHRYKVHKFKRRSG